MLPHHQDIITTTIAIIIVSSQHDHHHKHHRIIFIITTPSSSSVYMVGTINFFSGSGRETMGPLMSTGDIDVLAFIGGISCHQWMRRAVI